MSYRAGQRMLLSRLVSAQRMSAPRAATIARMARPAGAMVLGTGVRTAVPVGLQARELSLRFWRKKSEPPAETSETVADAVKDAVEPVTSTPSAAEDVVETAKAAAESASGAVAESTSAVAGAVADTAQTAVAAVSQAAEVLSSGPYVQTVSLANNWWWPPDFFVHILEFAHYNLQLPWWAAIVGVVLALRVAMFPVFLKISDNQARMAAVRDDLNRITEGFQSAADSATKQKFMLRRRRLMAKARISNMWLVAPILSIPIFIGVFSAVSRLANADAGLGLEHQGIFWFENLKQTDQYFGLPILGAITSFTSVKLGGESGAVNSTTGLARRVILVVAPAATFLTGLYLSSASSLLLVTTTLWVTLQGAALQNPAFRNLFRLTPFPKIVAKAAASPAAKSPSFRERYAKFAEGEKKKREAAAATAPKAAARTLSTPVRRRPRE
ncbi:60Kd inner membrane protein-domain-containing protein [Dipodascopsis tothii]|uniref:60Kd inner membrane protein-domain-containing protein n=1 Tax=Dipodascopsis tothii TaxID=44089 RepID=UPI0034CE1B47